MGAWFGQAAGVISNCTADTEPVRLFGAEVERTTAAYLVTIADLASALVLGLTILVFWVKIGNDEANYQQKHVQIQKYSGESPGGGQPCSLLCERSRSDECVSAVGCALAPVHVTGLPLDATKDEILEHFDR